MRQEMMQWHQLDHMQTIFTSLIANYELLRRLVEMQSRDVDHYHYINVSQSTVCHYNDTRSL